MIKKLLILLVTVTIVYGAYEYYKIRVKGYPVKTYLLSNQYRLLPVIIKGRTNTHIHFSHRNKNQLYFYQIDNLHLVSRLQIKLYPLHSQLSNISHSNRDPVRSNQTQVLVSHEKAISRVEELKRKLNSTQSQVEERSIKREIDREMIRIWEIEKKLFQSGVDYQPYNSKIEGSLLKKLINLLEKVANRSGKTLE
ncbi:MAG: hypothetical protein MK120_04985 [Puniceicoccaceae bacterium]|nr:hypothetical protein [Puniceicoccaceae bacterium]